MVRPICRNHLTALKPSRLLGDHESVICDWQQAIWHQQAVDDAVGSGSNQPQAECPGACLNQMRETQDLPLRLHE